MPTDKYYCFTLFPDGETEVQYLEKQPWDTFLTTAGGFLRYIVFQLETAPTTLRHHYQGYLELTHKKSIKQLKETFPGLAEAHFEIRRGTRDEARKYCKKDETRADPDFFNEVGPWEWGIWVDGQGARTDVASVVALVQSGSRPEDVAEQVPALYLRLHRGVQALHAATQLKPKTRDVDVCVYWGEAGSGKTFQAFEQLGTDVYVKEPHNTWFCGYSGQTCLLIDDFDPKDNPKGATYRQLLRWLDRYPVQVEVKGGNVWAQWDKVIITSNKHPRDWYDGQPWCMDGHAGQPGPLARRIRLVRRFTVAAMARAVAALAPPRMPAEDEYGAEDEEMQEIQRPNTPVDMDIGDPLRFM